MIEKPELFALGDDQLQLSHQEEVAIPLLLRAASRAIAAPRQSEFPVQAAAMNVTGHLVNGGNREYGLSRAYVHGEEAVVSRVLGEYPDVPLLGIGFYAESEPPELMGPCPCGNCRDVLCEEADPSLLLVAGNQKIAVAARLGSFLFDGFQAAEPEVITDDPVLQRALNAAHRARLRATTDYLPQSLLAKVYGLALIDASEHIYPGSFDTTAGYDAITPGVAAIQSFRNRPEGSKPGLSKLAAVVIAYAGGGTAAPYYRDRNAILELDGILQAAGDTFSPAPVYIIDTDTDGQPLHLARTDTRQWLPHAFTDSTLGMEEIATVKRRRLDTYL